ncbi:helix-turn-helix domain-containing protein [Plantactinospora sp. GCM10030261]|uniref:helix-turn-helix domain-containing protein n=1 Tax=Plantactinospora sp. GCM10030261 TaxID=3273420 RepID=UPI003615A7D5
MIGPGHGGDGSGQPVPGWAGIGSTTLRDLRDGPGFGRPQLLTEHQLILVTVGHGTHEVDFSARQCRPGTLVWARPGQVVRCGGQPGLDAVVLCWDDRVAAGPPDTGGHWQLAGEDEDAVISEISQLVVDCRRHGPGRLAGDLLRHQLTVLLLRLALLPATGESADCDTYRRLRDELERSYATTRRVEDYADRLRCSVRTLTRACLAATGRSAKQVIDDRVTLQAMRLLAATDEPVADVGRRLGFPEPTNFGRFFQREVGWTPGGFRAAQPGRRGPSDPSSSGTRRP